MKISIEGNRKQVNALFKQAKNSKLIVEVIKEISKEEITEEEIRTFLTEKGVKFHKASGIKKLTILYNENK